MAGTILVISDTHGYHTNLRAVIERERENFDAVFHLGDVEGADDLIREMAGCPVRFVRGNCDGWCDLPGELDFTQWGHHFFLTHGHRFFVYNDPSDLAAEAAARGADVALYGHTHKPLIQMCGEVLVVNPGSISRPRQADRRASYILMHVEENKPVDCELKYLDD